MNGPVSSKDARSVAIEIVSMLNDVALDGRGYFRPPSIGDYLILTDRVEALLNSHIRGEAI